jgi:hypothetical protein
MQGNKTHQQERSIIEKQVNTGNADKGFDARADLKRNEAAREAYRKGNSLDIGDGDRSMQDDPSIVRGFNQESKHNQ